MMMAKQNVYKSLMLLCAESLCFCDMWAVNEDFTVKACASSDWTSYSTSFREYAPLSELLELLVD